MNTMKQFLFAMLIAGLVVAPLAFAGSTPKEIFNACKSEATTNEIPAEDMQNYLRQCMEDHGIEAADVDNTLEQMAPKADSQGDQG